MLLRYLPESYFGARTRAINSLLYAAAQTTGTLLLLATLDYKGSGDFRRHQIIVVAGVAFCTTLCWVTFLVWNYRYADENGLQDWDFPGYTLACMSMILHGLNSGVVSITLSQSVLPLLTVSSIGSLLNTSCQKLANARNRPPHSLPSLAQLLVPDCFSHPA